jgi:hypothetical protein
MVFDSDGKLFLGLVDRKGKYVAPLVSGGTTSWKGAISSSAIAPLALAAGPDGSLFVLEKTTNASGDDNPLDAVFGLTPGSDSGGGGGKPPKKK